MTNHILIGQYDSPFLRRVAITMHSYGIAYDREVLSVFGDADDMAERHPLIKVPVLKLPSGEPIYDSQIILDYLDEVAGPENSLTPPRGADRRAVLRAVVIGWGVSEKAVSLAIDRNIYPEPPTMAWRDRLARQIALSLAWLEREAAADDWFLLGRLTQADITTVCALEHLAFRHGHLFDWADYPTLKALQAKVAALPAYQAVPLVEG